MKSSFKNLKSINWRTMSSQRQLTCHIMNQIPQQLAQGFEWQVWWPSLAPNYYWTGAHLPPLNTNVIGSNRNVNLTLLVFIDVCWKYYNNPASFPKTQPGLFVPAQCGKPPNLATLVRAMRITCPSPSLNSHPKALCCEVIVFKFELKQNASLTLSKMVFSSGPFRSTLDCPEINKCHQISPFATMPLTVILLPCA